MGHMISQSKYEDFMYTIIYKQTVFSNTGYYITVKSVIVHV